jgi:hypothetical protein
MSSSSVAGVSMKFSERVRDPTAEFAILKTLGKGCVRRCSVHKAQATDRGQTLCSSFGAVYHAREIATGIEVAIKKLTVVQENDLRDTIKEIEIMKNVGREIHADSGCSSSVSLCFFARF